MYDQGSAQGHKCEKVRKKFKKIDRNYPKQYLCIEILFF
jgi:hypothetical protein